MRQCRMHQAYLSQVVQVGTTAPAVFSASLCVHLLIFTQGVVLCACLDQSASRAAQCTALIKSAHMCLNQKLVMTCEPANGKANK